MAHWLGKGIPMMRRSQLVSVLLLVLWLTLSAVPARGQLFSDDFESGDLSAWDVVVGEAPKAFRFADLDLRDPHLFAEVEVVIVLCLDFTDEPLPVVNFSFNGSLETQITTDSDADDFLDLSTLLLFRPLDPEALAGRVDLVAGECLAPIGVPTTCAADPVVVPTMLTYDGLTTGSCLETVAGTTSGYTPGVGTPSSPCFVTLAETVAFQLGDLVINLEDVQISAALSGEPVATSLESGLIRGFLSEADADALLLPAELPLVGGQPLSVLLPGGNGNCAEGDDRDLHKGVMGWWFYFNFRADRSRFLGL